MFRINEEHMQGKLFSAINQLPKQEKQGSNHLGHTPSTIIFSL